MTFNIVSIFVEIINHHYLLLVHVMYGGPLCVYRVNSKHDYDFLISNRKVIGCFIVLVTQLRDKYKRQFGTSHDYIAVELFTNLSSS